MKTKIYETIQPRSGEAGQSLTELGLSLMFILILLAGVVDLGRAFFHYIALRDAAQEGALYGSIQPGDQNGIESRIRNSSNLLQGLMNNPGADTDIDVAILGSPCTGNAIRVRVAYENFPLTMPFIGAFLGRQTFGISASVTDTILSPACN